MGGGGEKVKLQVSVLPLKHLRGASGVADELVDLLKVMVPAALRLNVTLLEPVELVIGLLPFQVEGSSVILVDPLESEVQFASAHAFRVTVSLTPVVP